MTERRYHDDEVRQILELATQADDVGRQTVGHADGLTLAEIQSIAQEVGVAPDAVARAATALDARHRSTLRRSMGMPIGVARTIPLPRAPTDAEWEQLVAELRATFRARGRVVAEGGFREWSNGNLHACVELTESGHRLRIGTVKGDASGINALGLAGIATSAVMFASIAAAGGLPEAVFAPVMIGAGGIGAFIANLVRLPRWARERQQQMEHIETRVRSIMGASRPGSSGDAS